MPAGVHDTKSGKVQPQGEGAKPRDDRVMKRGIVFHFLEEGQVLISILGVPWVPMVVSEIFAGILWVWSVPGDRIQLVIAHHGQGRTLFDHVADERNRTNLMRTSIDEIADKNGLASALRMLPRRQGLPVPQHSQQGLELFPVTVDVANDVVFDWSFPEVALCGPPLIHAVAGILATGLS